MNNVDIKLLFAGLQEQMIAQLSTNRQFITHSGSKGDALENAWIEWLRKYLPNRYSVDKAIVIDHEGNTSQQIDIIIYDNWFTPFIFSQNGFHYIPAEGVYAVFEVKPDLQGNIKYAAEKIESVRNLKRTSTQMISSGTPSAARPLTKIIGGILTSTNTYTNSETIKNHVQDLQGFQGLDLGCAADFGSFFVDYEGEEDINIKDKEKFRQRYENYYAKRTFKDLQFSKPENSLVTFFMQLTQYLQQAIGTVPAIDLQAYLDKIGETIDKEL